MVDHNRTKKGYCRSMYARGLSIQAADIQCTASVAYQQWKITCKISKRYRVKSLTFTVALNVNRKSCSVEAEWESAAGIGYGC